MSGSGLVIAAPASASGKTTVTLGVLRALKARGHSVRAAKTGPDYIDAAFHAAATGAPCQTLDAWAMGDDRLCALAAGDGLLVIEGAMGLFDGAPPDGRGSAADLAKRLNLPVVLVVDARSMGQSIAALIGGFLGHDPELSIAGIIVNAVGSAKHERMLKAALSPLDVPILGYLPRRSDLARPSRHLGLVPAGEHPDLEHFLDAAAEAVGAALDLDGLIDIATPLPQKPPGKSSEFQPLGKRIAVAQDVAFSFFYPHMRDDWLRQGAEIVPFSPLADEAPDPEADAIFLPGGYPELHAPTLARAGRFRAAMATAAARDVTIYGECGGYMVLGEAITDARGVAYPMTGLLPLETSFAKRRLHLGYRSLEAEAGPFPGPAKAHEFHYSSVLHERGTPLFQARDAEGTRLDPMGLVSGNVSGSFVHLIDQCA